VARATGHGRMTVRRWVETAQALGWDPRGELEPDEALARAVAARRRPVRAPALPGESEARLVPQREQIRAWLAREDGSRGLRLTKVHELLRRQGVDVPYSSLHRFAAAYCGFHDRRRVTVRMAEVPPGEVAEVDFGKLGLVFDPAQGRRRTLHALIVTLVHSRHQYVHVTFSQKVADLIAGLEDAWTFFDGVPRRVILDNLKAAVTKADRYDPIFQRSFAEYAAYRGFLIDTAIVRHATGKPHVERQVQYVRESFFRGETWIDRDHVQRDAERWCREAAGQRVHGTTRKRPLEVFDHVEHPALERLVRERFDPPQWTEAKVHPDHHVQFQKAFYSAPTRHVGKQVWVRGDSKLVRLYVESELIATHTRVKEGKRSTNYAHYPPERADYAMRDPDRAIREAQRQGTHVGRFTKRLLAGSFPWAKLRQAQKLLRLCRKYGPERVDQACARALAFDLVNVHKVERILVHAITTPVPDPEQSGQLVLLPARFQRPASHFRHDPNPEPKETPDGDQPVPEADPQAPEALGPARHAPRACGLRNEDEAR
jgi:transposase